MREFVVTKSEEGLSILKLSRKLLPDAPSSLLHKFIRNKNIELNGKKTAPNSPVKSGDKVLFFLSDETYDKLSCRSINPSKPHELKDPQTQKAGADGFDIQKSIVYEDENIILLNKPAGLLSQGDDKNEVSLNDCLLRYLNYSPEERVIKPSICNRLDKNTSGLIAGGKSAAGLSELNRGFSGRNFVKTYLTYVCGRAELNGEYRAYLKKDRANNTALLSSEAKKGYDEICTGFSANEYLNLHGKAVTLLTARLITGKPHQIRAHLKFLGYPVLGDKKYFDKGSRELSEGLKLKQQLLHSLSVKFFFDKDSPLYYLNEREFAAPLPEDFNFTGEVHGNMEFKGLKGVYPGGPYKQDK